MVLSGLGATGAVLSRLCRHHRSWRCCRHHLSRAAATPVPIGGTLSGSGPVAGGTRLTIAPPPDEDDRSTRSKDRASRTTTVAQRDGKAQEDRGRSGACMNDRNSV